MKSQINNYLNNLTQICVTNVNNKFNITKTNFNKFDNVNAFLIDKTIESDNDNLFVKIPYDELKRDFYIPLFFSIAHSLFLKNYVDNKTAFKISDVVQDEFGKRYEITSVNNNSITLQNFDKCNTTINMPLEKIEKYFVTTAKVSKRTVKIKFDAYRKFYNELFPSITTFPSKFSYKAILIVEKKEFIETIKEFESNYELKKILPFKWITKQGIKGKGSEFLPIEPMIYIAPDYETAKEFAFDEIDNLDVVVFVGKNKYIHHLAEISKDIRLKRIPKTIIIGSESVTDFKNTKTWEWTQKEVNIFNEVKYGELNLIKVEPTEFLHSLDSLNQKLEKIESEYSVHLEGTPKLERYVYSLILPDFETRLTIDMMNSEGYYRNYLRDEIRELYFSSGQDSNSDLDEIDKLIVDVFDNINSVKFIKLISIDEKIILLVSKRLKTTFENLEIANVTIFSVEEFLEIENRYTTEKNVYLLSIFGFEYLAKELIKILTETKHNINFILYPEEHEICKMKINRIKNKDIRIISHIDRKSLTGIEFIVEEKTETLSEKLERLSESGMNSYCREYSPLDGVEYEIIYENGDSDILLGGKSVLLTENAVSRKEKVSLLKIGDTVRVYSNEVPELLYKIAKSSGEKYFEEIEKYSKLWKDSLRTFSLNVDNEFNYESEEKILEHICKELALNGCKVKENTIKNWIKQNSKTMFPQKRNLIALKQTLDDNKFNESFKALMRNKKIYESMMIALGRDLSDEIVDYVSSKKRKKGEMLQKFSDDSIDALVKVNAPERSIEDIKPLGESADE